MLDEFVNEAGDVITETMVITTFGGREFDITNFCIETQIYEDVFSNVMVGKCLLVDAANLITKIPIQGTEYLTLSFRTPTLKQKISRTFLITALKNREFGEGVAEQRYVLEFMSIEGVMDEQRKISKKFSGTTDDIVKNIFVTYLQQRRNIKGSEAKSGLVTSDASHNTNLTMVAPYWSPLKIINWVASRSKATQAGAPSVLFFESNKQFYFLSVEDLILRQRDTGKVFTQLYYSPSANMITEAQGSFGSTALDIGKQYRLVSKMKAFDQFDALRSTDLGHFASRLITHDMVLKQYKEFDYDHFVGGMKFNAAEDYVNVNGQISADAKKLTSIVPPAQLRTPLNRIAVSTTHYDLFNGSGSENPERWMQQRNSLLSDISNLRISVDLPGRTDIEVGKLVEYLYPKGVEKTEGADVSNAYDPYLSGLYIITAIRHTFSLNKHSMILELAKDSYKTPLKP